MHCDVKVEQSKVELQEEHEKVVEEATIEDSTITEKEYLLSIQEIDWDLP